MSRQIAKKSGAKLAKPQPAKLEPLTNVAQDRASIADWLRRFDALPLWEKNEAIRENKGVADILYGNVVTEGRLLIGPLTAEANQDSAQGENTYLTILKPLRDRLVREYEIKTAAECMLVDALVVSYYQYVRAVRSLFSYTAYNKTYNYETLVRFVQTYQSRANELFLKNLEALRQMKAAPFVVKIAQAGQVNVGEKQVNVAAEGGGTEPVTRAAQSAQPSSELEVPHPLEAVRERAEPGRQLGPILRLRKYEHDP